jgi:hypothetical protein
MARGAGAPPPRKSGGGGSDKPVYHLAEEVKTSDGKPLLKMVKALKVRPGTKNHPILTLDDFIDLEKDGWSVNLHMFNLRGTKDNIVICPKTETDPRPCPVCEVLNKDPSWYICLSGIDRNKYTFDRKNKQSGKMEKVTYTDLRRLILVTHTWCPRMTMHAERTEGWRGSLWEVSRSEPVEIERDGQKTLSFKDSPRIGDVWYPSEKYDEEKMKAELEKAAATYGLPVEAFIQPFDYETLLKPKDHAQLQVIANDIRQDGSALKDGGSDVNPTVGAASGTSEAEINY